MTAEEYLVAYALRHRMSIDMLRRSATVRECRCGLAGCQGWEIVWHDDPIPPHLALLLVMFVAVAAHPLAFVRDLLGRP